MERERGGRGGEGVGYHLNVAACISTRGNADCVSYNLACQYLSQVIDRWRSSKATGMFMFRGDRIRWSDARPQTTIRHVTLS